MREGERHAAANGDEEAVMINNVMSMSFIVCPCQHMARGIKHETRAVRKRELQQCAWWRCALVHYRYARYAANGAEGGVSMRYEHASGFAQR